MFLEVLCCSIMLAIANGGIPTHEEHHYPPQPYKFGYKIKSKHGSQWRSEDSNGHGSVVGSYGFTDDHGLHREVKYVADKHGFRAKIRTNEPGTANQNPAHVTLHANPVPSYYSAYKPSSDQQSLYALSANAPPVYVYNGGHQQTPWFPLKIGESMAL